MALYKNPNPYPVPVTLLNGKSACVPPRATFEVSLEDFGSESLMRLIRQKELILIEADPPVEDKIETKPEQNVVLETEKSPVGGEPEVVAEVSPEAESETVSERPTRRGRRTY